MLMVAGTMYFVCKQAAFRVRPVIVPGSILIIALKTILRKIFRLGFSLLVAFLIPLSLITAQAQTPSFDIDLFQPPIVSDVAPERPLRGSYSLANNTTRIGLASFKAQIPAYNGRGFLLASWTPHPKGVANRPTFVIIHGGHGLVPTNFASALWARQTLGANVLVLDSYWSRGRDNNWETWTPFGANMRALDVIAAARWLKTTQGIDPSKLVLMGDSQGGWTVLRAFTNDPYLRNQMKGLYRAGVALYPNCRSDASIYRPQLGPYTAPVIIFTGGKDTATPVSECDDKILRAAKSWKHYPLDTHGWDTANRGAHTPAANGECERAMNVYNHFAVCRNDATTNDMRRRIIKFLGSMGIRDLDKPRL